MEAKDISPNAIALWISLGTSIATGGWFMAKLDSRTGVCEDRISAVERRVAEVQAEVDESEDRVIAAIRKVRCWLEPKFQDEPSPECS